ncbi:MAG: glycosyltransferase family 87 protein [Terracidiphilus sp.]|jgi:hypothetical protein
MREKRSPLRTFAAALIVAAGTCLVTGVYAIGIDNQNATERDFIQYWAAERQLIHGANPYDVNAIFHMEKALGMAENTPKVTVSPPVAFFYALPLGYLSAKAALIVWLLILLGATGISAWLLWLIFGRPNTRLHLLVFAFPPTLSCLMAGQLGIFFLLGVVLFLFLHKSRPWLAGVALLPCALKPHLFLPCVVVLLLWSAHRKEFRIVAGFLVALAVSCVLTLRLDSHIWPQYWQLIHSARLMDVFLPTVSVGFRFLIDRHDKWIEFVPIAIGCMGSAWFYWMRRDHWEWMDQGMIVLLVSVACSPYSWFSDQALLFPAILAGMLAAENRAPKWILLGLIVAGSLPGVLFAIELPSPFYVWTAPAWLLWYLFAKRGKGKGALADSPMAAISR